MKTAATSARNFRTFLLVSQLEAKEIGARIALARKEAGLTQEQVSQMSTVSKRSLQNYEAGTTIPYRHMRELSAMFDRPVEWFLHGQLPEEDAVTLAEIVRRLESLEALVAKLPTAEHLRRGLETLRVAIDARANPGTRRARKAV